VCSAHYFDERDGIVAQGWYQQGTRFLDVSDPTDIRQIGYFIPPACSADPRRPAAKHCSSVT